MFSIATRSSGTDANRSARRTSLSTILAQQKMEQLRGLTWGFDAFGLPVNDFSTDIAVSPASPVGGTGIGVSPSGTLVTNTVGFVDFLGPYGQWLGTGEVPPNGTVYVRRWAIEALPTNPNNTLIFQVRVTRIAQASDRVSVDMVEQDTGSLGSKHGGASGLNHVLGSSYGISGIRR